MEGESLGLCDELLQWGEVVLIITAITGPVSYKVMLTDGQVVRGHADRIRT